MPTDREKRDFADFINDNAEVSLSKGVLDATLKYVRDNFEPGDIWDDDKIRNYVAGSSLPTDVFDDKELIEWAENNGYTLPGEVTN